MANQPVPGYWVSIPASIPPTSPGVPTGTDIRQRGAFVGVLGELAKWANRKFRVEPTAIDKVSLGEAANKTLDAINGAGTTGYLFHVRIYDDVVGAEHILGRSPFPVGPGNSVSDAVARNIEDGIGLPSLSQGEALEVLPQAGWKYSNGKSFFVWVEKKSGELHASIHSFPLATFLSVKRIKEAGLSEAPLQQRLEERALAFEKAANSAAAKSRSQYTRLYLRDLLLSRKSAAAALQSSAEKLRQAEKAASDAEMYQTMATIFSLGSSFANAAAKFQAISSTNLATANENFSSNVSVFVQVEQHITVTIQSEDPAAITPSPVQKWRP